MKELLALAAVTAAMAVSQALADFIPLPVKWSQPIGYEPGTGVIIGKDRLSDHTVNVVRADDFICNDPLPIVAVRWWGSYIGEGPNGLPPRPTTPPATVAFDLDFYASTGGPHPVSLPTALLLGQIVFAQEDFVGVDQTGEYVYRYDAYLTQPFFQQGTTANPVEYFMAIDQPSGQAWGWHEAPTLFMDSPAFSPAHGGPWTSIAPMHDLAFELMTIPEPGVATLGGFGLLALLISRRRR